MLKGGPEGPGLLQEKFERSERTGFLHNLFINVIHEYQNKRAFKSNKKFYEKIMH